MVPQNRASHRQNDHVTLIVHQVVAAVFDQDVQALPAQVVAVVLALQPTGSGAPESFG